MPTTENLDLPFPAISDENNPPRFIQELAEALDTMLAPKTYTPLVTSTTSPAATATYVVVGKFITVEFDVVLGGGLSANPTISLPPGMEFAVVQAKGIGTAILIDISPANTRLATVSVSNSTAVSMSYEQSNVRTGLSSAGPWSWSAGDSMRGSFTARLA